MIFSSGINFQHLKHLIYYKYIQKLINYKVFKIDNIAAVNPDIVNKIVSVKIIRFVPYKIFFSVDFI